MYVDYKVTMWKRIHYPDSVTIDDIKNAVEGKQLRDITVDDLFIENSEVEDLFDTMEELPTNENDDATTIECYIDEDSEIWNNINGFIDNEG